MFNSHQAKNFVMYSLVSLFFTAYPALAQGEKIVEFDETRKFVEIALIVISALLAINALMLLFGGVPQIAGGDSGFSALFPSLAASFFGVIIILSGGFIIGQLTPILITLISIFCTVFVATLFLALAHR